MEEGKEHQEEKKEFQKFALDGDVYKTILTKKWLSRKPYEPNDPDLIMSFIPGTIIKVIVKEGQAVKKGDHLLILEAMKMHNIILAPHPAKIKKIYVVVGEKVTNKQLLIEMEPEIIKVKIKEKKKQKK